MRRNPVTSALFAAAFALAGAFAASTAPSSAAADEPAGRQAQAAAFSYTPAPRPHPVDAFLYGDVQPTPAAYAPRGRSKIVDRLQAEMIVDLSEQKVEVFVDGVLEDTYRVSTGRRGFYTPTGTFQPTWLSPRHRSSLYDDAPMPWAVFFNGGIAFHGTNAVHRLGRVASHGCVRLRNDHAERIFRLVQAVGRENVTIRVVN